MSREITPIQSQLKQLRLDANMTTREVADFVGCSPASVSQWENGRTEPTFQTIAKLSACYGFICTVRFDVNDDEFFARYKTQEAMVITAADVRKRIAEIEAGESCN